MKDSKVGASTKLSERPWFERAIRQHADEHGPSGGAWNISSMLELLHRARETGASGAGTVQEQARDLSNVGCGCGEDEADSCVSFARGFCHRQENAIAVALQAAAERMRERAAKVAHDFTLEANQGRNRLKVPDSWKDMTPADVYNLGADDAATYIWTDIRALPTDGE